MKDITNMLEYMVKSVDKIHFVSWPHFKLASLETLMGIAYEVEKNLNERKNEVFQPIIEDGNISKTLEKVLKDASNNDVILVCGSFYIMEEVRDFFCIEEEKDPKTVNT